MLGYRHDGLQLHSWLAYRVRNVSAASLLQLNQSSDQSSLEIDSDIFCTNTAISSFVHVESVTSIKIRLNNTAAVKWRMFCQINLRRRDGYNMYCNMLITPQMLSAVLQCTNAENIRRAQVEQSPSIERKN